METIKIDIVNPKAKRLLKELEELNLIKIKDEKEQSDLQELLRKLRNQNQNNFSLEDITAEVEAERKSRYEN